jgi:hypothetical protein
MKPSNRIIPALLVGGLVLVATAFDAVAQENAHGKITFLRVHDVGTGFGPPADFLDAEVVILLDTQPGKAFGFQLRDDVNGPAHRGMLDILRDALNNNWTVYIDHNTPAGKNNGYILRAWITKPLLDCQPVLVHGRSFSICLQEIP